MLDHLFQDFLQSSFNYNKDPPKAKEYSNVARKFLALFGVDSRIRTAVKFLNARLMEEYIESYSSKRATSKLNVLVCLVKFVTFSNHQEMLSSNFLSPFKSSISGLQRTYTKQKNEGKITSQTEKIIITSWTTITPRLSVTPLSDTLVTAYSPTIECYIKFIIATILLNSGAQTGAVPGVLIEEVLNSRIFK